MLRTLRAGLKRSNSASGSGHNAKVTVAAGAISSVVKPHAPSVLRFATGRPNFGLPLASLYPVVREGRRREASAYSD